MEEKLRFVISGGGTGGHIFPAVSIANALREMHPDADILFVGALGRMEMQRVPAGIKLNVWDSKNSSETPTEVITADAEGNCEVVVKVSSLLSLQPLLSGVV